MAANNEASASYDLKPSRQRSKSKSFDEENLHVQFKLSQDDLAQRHDSIEITKIGKHIYDVHLGYLKVDHFYRVSFKLEHDFDELVHLKEGSSKNVTLEHLKKLSNGEHEFQFLFYAYREKLDKEQVLFTIKDANTEQCLCINFEAKVLGLNQGTPVLRNGVTLVSHKHTHSDKCGHFNFM